MLNQSTQKNLLMTVLLLLALGFSIWLMQQSFLRPEDANTSQPTTPDAFMTQADYTRYDAQGGLSSFIHTARLVHYADQDRATLESPKIVSRNGSPLSWEITAGHGTTQHGLKTVFLKDNVQVKRIHALKGVTLTLNTAELTAFPQQRFAQTDQPVTIIQPGSVVYATGLTADMATGDIHLLSNVRGTYEKSAS